MNICIYGASSNKIDLSFMEAAENLGEELKEAYQKVYGPLTKEFPCNKWRWLEEPWPWEGECGR